MIKISCCFYLFRKFHHERENTYYTSSFQADRDQNLQRLSLPSNAFFRDTIEETYNQGPPLSIHLKIFLFKFFCCL
jgi:hypothetical protein